MQSDRGPRNSSWLGARSTPVVGLEHHTVDIKTAPEELNLGLIHFQSDHNVKERCCEAGFRVHLLKLHHPPSGIPPVHSGKPLQAEASHLLRLGGRLHSLRWSKAVVPKLCSAEPWGSMRGSTSHNEKIEKK
ncbi:hypothetical protein TNCV_3094291 [Trichonephila clavipes]|nr:hypothetical protein TNCV_3094291 [Trichonephila clavipes]